LPGMSRKCLYALLDRNAAGSLSWAHCLRKPLSVRVCTNEVNMGQ
jgi:hypothetical protein